MDVRERCGMLALGICLCLGMGCTQSKRQRDEAAILSALQRQDRVELRALIETDRSSLKWAYGKEGDSLIGLAAYSGDTNIVALLFEMGANVNQASLATQRRPLHMGAMHDGAIAEMLIDRGADVHRMDGMMGDTPLHLAALLGNDHVVEVLVRRGADVNAKAWRYGEPPLFNAVSTGRASTVALLLKLGADLSMKNDRGWTALSIAKSRVATFDAGSSGKAGKGDFSKADCEEMVRLLEPHMANQASSNSVSRVASGNASTNAPSAKPPP